MFLELYRKTRKAIFLAMMSMLFVACDDNAATVPTGAVDPTSQTQSEKPLTLAAPTPTSSFSTTPTPNSNPQQPAQTPVQPPSGKPKSSLLNRVKKEIQKVKKRFPLRRHISRRPLPPTPNKSTTALLPPAASPPATANVSDSKSSLLDKIRNFKSASLKKTTPEKKPSSDPRSSLLKDIASFSKETLKEPQTTVPKPEIAPETDSPKTGLLASIRNFGRKLRPVTKEKEPVKTSNDDTNLTSILQRNWGGLTQNIGSSKPNQENDSPTLEEEWAEDSDDDNDLYSTKTEIGSVSSETPSDPDSFSTEQTESSETDRDPKDINSEDGNDDQPELEEFSGVIANKKFTDIIDTIVFNEKYRLPKQVQDEYQSESDLHFKKWIDQSMINNKKIQYSLQYNHKSYALKSAVAPVKTRLAMGLFQAKGVKNVLKSLAFAFENDNAMVSFITDNEKEGKKLNNFLISKARTLNSSHSSLDSANWGINWEDVWNHSKRTGDFFYKIEQPESALQSKLRTISNLYHFFEKLHSSLENQTLTPQALLEAINHYDERAIDPAALAEIQGFEAERKNMSTLTDALSLRQKAFNGQDEGDEDDDEEWNDL